MKVY
jgi:16S rRNA C967 or C1407 C5-methylase (RsmB/RsmF family)